jgi:hypothetical protein
VGCVDLVVEGGRGITMGGTYRCTAYDRVEDKWAALCAG